jgi:exo-beta-1,3-glucanase (GH17 family)
MYRRRPHSNASQLARIAAALVCALAILAVGASAAAAVPQYRGAQVHSLWPTVSSTEMTEELNALQTAGVNVLRVDVGWATLETSKGGYDPTYLAKLDALSAGAAARGIKLIATLWQTPSWASSAGAWNDAPSNPAYYGAFAQFIASRYGSELAAIEVWNEPEVSENLISSNLPLTYVELVKAAYTGVKQGSDPNVPVLAGSLSYADVPFLDQLYADGIKGYYNGISLHPYADGAAPANTSVTHSFLGGIESLHAAQLAAGDDTPEWVTEFGWPTGTSKGANTEQQQAEYTEQAFALLNNLPYVEGATVYELRDMETNPADPEDNFGMLRQNFTPTPAYAALTAAMHSTAGPPESFRPGAPETGSGKSESGSGAGGSASGAGGSESPPPGAGQGSPEAGASGAGASGAGASGSGSGSSWSGIGAGPSSNGSTGAGPHHTRGGSPQHGSRAHVASARSHHRLRRRIRRRSVRR